MGILRRAKVSFRNYGLRATVLKIVPLIVDRLYDLRYGVETSAWAELNELTIESENKKRGSHYKPTKVLPLMRLLTIVKSRISNDSILVDFGCGKGRVLLVASHFGFKAVRGVEFAHELCKIARNNITIYRSKPKIKAECQIIESDVTDYPIKDDENVFFMNAPFDETVLKKVLDNISVSLQKQARTIVIIYHNPYHARVLNERAEFRLIEEHSLWGNDFILYSNEDQINDCLAHSPS